MQLAGNSPNSLFAFHTWNDPANRLVVQAEGAKVEVTARPNESECVVTWPADDVRERETVEPVNQAPNGGTGGAVLSSN